MNSHEEAPPVDEHKKHLSFIVKNTAIVGLGTVYNYVLTPFIAVATTRVLGAELYGIYSLVQSWGSLLANFSSLGYAGASYRLLPKYKAFGKAGFIKGTIFLALLVSTVVSLFLTGVLVFIPNVFCDYFVNSAQVSREPGTLETMHGAFRFYGISILLTSLYLVIISSLNGIQAVKERVFANSIIGPTVKALTLAVLIYMGMDLYAALLSNILQDLAILAVSVYFLIKLMPSLLDRKVKTEYEAAVVGKFAGTLFLGQLLNKYTFQLDILLLGIFGTLADVGIYAVALRLQPLIYLPHYTLMSTFGPIVGELHAKSRIEEMGRLYKSVTKWSFTASSLIASLIVVYADEILLIFGKEFAGGLTVLLILSVANLIHDLLGIGNNLILMAGKVMVNLYNSILIAVINGSAFYFLIYHYGALGAAIGSFISLTIINLVILFEVRYIFGFHPFQWSLLKPVGAVMAAVIVSLILKSYTELPFYKYSFLLLMLVHAIVYAGTIYLLGLDSEDRELLGRIKKRFSRRS